jgi:hypothetical protein
MGRMSQFGSFWECDRNTRGKRDGPLAASAY